MEESRHVAVLVPSLRFSAATGPLIFCEVATAENWYRVIFPKKLGRSSAHPFYLYVRFSVSIKTITTR